MLLAGHEPKSRGEGSCSGLSCTRG